MTRLIFCLCAVACATACAPTASPDLTETCMAAAFADLIGQPASAAASVPEPKRVLAPGDAATMDYLPNRTNVMLSKDGTIASLNCG